jgi:hypothetical protein
MVVMTDVLHDYCIREKVACDEDDRWMVSARPLAGVADFEKEEKTWTWSAKM